MSEPSELEMLWRRLSWLRGYAAARDDRNLLDCVELVQQSIDTITGPGPEPGLSESDGFEEFRGILSPEHPKDTPDEDSAETMVEIKVPSSEVFPASDHIDPSTGLRGSDEGTPASLPITPMADLRPGETINPVVDHEDDEFTGERTYIYADGTRSKPCAAPASWSPNGSAETE
jgi:hypothetical protein